MRTRAFVPHTTLKSALSCTFTIASLVVLLALVWSAALPRTAYAYVDPSVMTYTIQALAGVAVALSAVAGVVIRRVRRKFMATFNVDETRGKAREGDVARIDPTSPGAPALFAHADERATALREDAAKTSEVRNLERLKWPKRFAFALLMCLFFVFIVLIAPAIEIFGANDESLVFSLKEVWWVTVVINMLLAVVAAALLSALHPRVFTRAMLVIFCITLAAYVQTFFLNSGMMPADGGYIGWNEWYFVRKMIVSGLVWVALIAIPLIASNHHRIVWLRATSLVAVGIIIMQAVGVGSVVANMPATGEHAKRSYVTNGELFTVSPASNVIVFVPDTYDTALMEEALAQNPHLLDNFTDFTYFRNALGTMIPTHYALPYLLSGEKPQANESLDDYRANRYARGKLLPTLAEAGYSIGAYTDSAMFDYSREADAATAKLTENIHPIRQIPLDVFETYVVLNQCALYREAPWVAKPLFWYYTTDINNRMIASVDDTERNAHSELYELDDAQFLATLQSSGLSFEDEGRGRADTRSSHTDSYKDSYKDSYTGAFRLIHLFGPHFPFNIDEKGQAVGTNQSNQERQALGTLKVIEGYIAELKRLGVYDNTTIIITADHGIWTEQDDPVKNPISPLLIVKPSKENAAGSDAGASDADGVANETTATTNAGTNDANSITAGAPCAVSDVPVSHEDVAGTIIDAIGGDASAFGSGQTVWDITDSTRTRTFDALTSAGGSGRRMVEYVVKGDALDLANWQKTGTEWSGA